MLWHAYTYKFFHMIIDSKTNAKSDSNRINEAKELSHVLISSIYEGHSFFEFVPHDIGQITFCATTVNKEKPDSVMHKLRKLVPYGLLAILLLPALFYLGESIFCMGLLVTIVGFPYYIYKEIIKFENLDFFVGTKGFCYVKFKKRRSNIVCKKIVLFDDVTDFFTQETDVSHNNIYTETQYFIQFISVLEDTYTVKFYERGRYKKGEIDIKRIFYNEIIKNWNAYKMKDLGKIPMSFHAYIIEKGAIEEVYLNFIEVENDSIKIGGKEYLYNELKKNCINGLELIVEGKNHQIVKKSFWRKEETGDVVRIGLEHVSNLSFFELYFVWLKKEKNL